MLFNKTDSLFVISDIHGCATELRLLLNKLPLTRHSKLVFLGDYINRGPNSREVIDTILELSGFCEVVALKGNHEQMMLDFISNPKSPQAGMFIYNGGGATLANYQVHGSKRIDIPKEHVDFFCSLSLFHEEEDYFFVHAGLPDIPIPTINPDEHQTQLLWIRKEFLNSQYDWGKMVIHGHSPVSAVQFRANRINIDTGCVYKNRLTALQLPQRTVYSVARQAEPKVIPLKDKKSRRATIRFDGAIPVYLPHGDTILQFESINYSELGVLIYDMIFTKDQTLNVDQEVRGAIGSKTHETIPFEGRVVRVDKVRSGPFMYAIQFTKSPYDMQRERRMI